MAKETRLTATNRLAGAAVLFFGQPVPRIIAAEGPEAIRRFVEFFTANIRNKNTRTAYAQAVGQFCRWSERRRFSLELVEPITVAAYIEELLKIRSKPTVKQHLAAIRMLFDWLVLGQIIPGNPASFVRGPKHVVKHGKTPVLSADDTRKLLDSIPLSRIVRQSGQEISVPDLVGLRDRALIAAMVFSFARVSAVIGMNVEDYYQNGKRSWLRLHEKGGKLHEVPAHHRTEEYLDEYINAISPLTVKRPPLFRSARGRTGMLGETRMSRTDVLRMIKRRARGAGLSPSTCCHTFRATGITTYRKNGGTIEKAQAIAGHESPRTTKLYDRTDDEITLNEIEKIRI